MPDLSHEQLLKVRETLQEIVRLSGNVPISELFDMPAVEKWLSTVHHDCPICKALEVA